MPKVSVIIPVYNGAATIGRALASVWAQTFTDYEIVVVNDGSTDDTASVLAGYGDRIHTIFQSNSGPSAARNAGVSASSGEYLAFLDDDDEWMPRKLELSIPVLEREPDCVLVYTRAFKLDQCGLRAGTLDGQTEGAESPTMKQLLERPWNVVPSQFVVTRRAFEQCGGFPERLSAFEDRYFLLRARELGHFHCVPEQLMRKTSRPLYPTLLQREPQYELFLEMVRARYGAAADGLIECSNREQARVFKQAGRVLMKQGRREQARRCLARVIHYEPTSPWAYRKYLKTFLPTRSSPRTGEQ